MPVMYEDPVKTPTAGPEEYTETHPAYAMVSVGRPTASPGKVLFGSDFRHQHFITLTVSPASVRRSLSNDWFYPSTQHHIQVALTEQQWARLLSSVGTVGVPCTVESIGRAQVPQIPAPVQRQAQFTGEVTARLQGIDRGLRDLREAVSALGKVNAKTRDELLRRIDGLRRQAGPAVEFVAEQFREHVERVTEQARGEVEAYVQQALTRAGLAALAGSATPARALPDGPDDAVVEADPDPRLP